MPLDLNCPKCRHVFPVTEARHPFGVECPGCESELTAEFRRLPVTTPGEPPYELLVTIGRPPRGRGAGDAAPRAMKLDDDEDGARRKGGSMMVVVIAALVAFTITVGGLGATGYFLFVENYDPDQLAKNDLLGSSDSRSSNRNRNPISGPPSEPINPGGGMPGMPRPQPQKKVDKFDLRPVPGAVSAITPPPNLPADGQTLELSFNGKAEAVAVAGGGRYIVVHVRDRGLLGVYDATKGQMIGGVETDRGDILLAGGANRVVTYAKDSKLFRVFSIQERGLVRDYEATTDMFFHANAIAMGNRTNGPLLACDPFGELFLYDVGPAALKEVDGARQKPGVHSGILKAFPDGTGFATYDGGNVQSVKVLGEERRDWKVANTRFGVVPGADGLLYGNGVVNDRLGRDMRFGSSGGGTGTWYVPSVSSNSNYFLKVSPAILGTGPQARRTISVSVHANRNSVVKVPGTPSLVGVQDLTPFADFGGNLNVPDAHRFTFGDYFFLIPEAKSLVTLKHDRTAFVLRRVEIP